MADTKSYKMDPAGIMAEEVRQVAAVLAGHGNILPELFPLAFEIVKHTAQKPKSASMPPLQRVDLILQMKGVIDKISNLVHDENALRHDKIAAIKAVLREYYSQ